MASKTFSLNDLRTRNMSIECIIKRANQLIEESRDESFKKGVEHGIFAVVKWMLERGVHPKFIHKITGIDPWFIDEVQGAMELE